MQHGHFSIIPLLGFPLQHNTLITWSIRMDLKHSVIKRLLCMGKGKLMYVKFKSKNNQSIVPICNTKFQDFCQSA